MSSESIPLIQVRSRDKRAPISVLRKWDHCFYTGIAVALLALIFAGFFRTYFGRPLSPSPALSIWLHIHGAVFTAWALLYVVQNVLVFVNRVSIHRQLGICGVVLAPAVVCMGLITAAREALQGRSFPFPDIYAEMAVSDAQMVLFAILVPLALLRRREVELHKRVMLMAALLFVAPAVGRLPVGSPALMLAIGLSFYFAGPVYDWLTRRSIHVAYRWGIPLLLLTIPPVSVAWSRIAIWHRLVDFVLHTS